jgi:sporulation related protein
VRTLAALALVLVACGRSDRRDTPAAYDASQSASASRGPDPLVLRVARGGGPARAYKYPRLDSAIWTSPDRAPSLERVLAFDAEAGSLAYVDAKGLPGRLDLRLGTARAAAKVRLASLTSADGWSIYGIAGDGSVTRLTPSGNWPYKPPSPARELFPQPDGSLLLLTDRRDGVTLYRLRPPQETLVDTALLPRSQRAPRTQVGDRLYFVVDSGLIGVRGADLNPVPSVRFRKTVRALVPTPSGDRLFVVTDSSADLTVIDRYQADAKVIAKLPGPPADLRMDPLGRYLLVRPLAGDSAWVVAVGTGRLVGSVATQWRPDLPFVAADGSIALATGNDVSFVDGETLKAVRRVAAGAKDFWYFFSWDGFRPRPKELDEPVVFAGGADSAADSLGDSLSAHVPPPGEDSALVTAHTPPPPPRRDSLLPQPQVFLVSFAALLSEERAREQAAEIRVGDIAAHIIPVVREGTTIYRVVLGPYTSRAEAERAGKAAGRRYWIFEGVP